MRSTEVTKTGIMHFSESIFHSRLRLCMRFYNERIQGSDSINRLYPGSVLNNQIKFKMCSISVNFAPNKNSNMHCIYKKCSSVLIGIELRSFTVFRYFRNYN